MSDSRKNVKVTFPFKSPNLANQLPSGCINIGDFYFYINPSMGELDEPFDYWVIYENLHRPVEKTALSRSGNTIFITGEPPSVKSYSPLFLKQFGLIITAHEGIKHSNVHNYQQALPWTIKKNYNALKAEKVVSKSKFMSIITSNKTLTDGHRKRLDFALKLKELYPEHIDLFGRGINEFQDKRDVLAPYKYHVCIENSSIRNYFTEKVVDSFLCLSLPLYYGCTNLEDYYDSRSFIKINIDNIDDCKKVIDALLKDYAHYDNSLPYLKDSKNKSLEQYNLFPFVKSVIEAHMGCNDQAGAASIGEKKMLMAPLDIAKYYIKKIR